MSDEVKLTAFATAECEARTIGDLRALLRWCDKYRVADDAGIDWGRGSVYVEITGDCAVPAEWIECGVHHSGDEHWDVLIETHAHPGYDEEEDDPIVCAVCGISHEHVDFGTAATAKFNNASGDYDYLCEPCAAEEPAKYDWPAKDRINRYGDEGMPG